MIELGCVTGRFQPVHCQHMELFEMARHECGHLIVAVTNPDPGARHPEPTSTHRHTAAANPFTYYERVRLLTAAFEVQELAGCVTIVPFDLTRPESWPEYVPLRARHFVRAYSEWERDKAQRIRAAGYAVTVIDGDPDRKLSATDIRRALSQGGDTWRRHVPPATIPLLVDMIAAAPMQGRG